ncbi:MAG: DUF1428 domain-containing protein [Luteolibacter sp.]
MSKYIDGFVLPLPKGKLEKYTQVATKAAAIWKEHGALEYLEAVGDDFKAEDMVDFPKLTGASAEETVIMAYIVYESREHRDSVNAKVMADPRIKEMCDPENPIFDYSRMAYGGFRAIVEK